MRWAICPGKRGRRKKREEIKVKEEIKKEKKSKKKKTEESKRKRNKERRDVFWGGKGGKGHARIEEREERTSPMPQGVLHTRLQNGVKMLHFIVTSWCIWWSRYSTVQIQPSRLLTRQAPALAVSSQPAP